MGWPRAASLDPWPARKCCPGCRDCCQKIPSFIHSVPLTVKLPVEPHLGGSPAGPHTIPPHGQWGPQIGHSADGASRFKASGRPASAARPQLTGPFIVDSSPERLKPGDAGARPWANGAAPSHRLGVSVLRRKSMGRGASTPPGSLTAVMAARNRTLGCPPLPSLFFFSIFWPLLLNPPARARV